MLTLRQMVHYTATVFLIDEFVWSTVFLVSVQLYGSLGVYETSSSNVV
jgi:hypothetical protein